ncbi:response regulator transcription factor, partial|nr:response regulator transcription factor [Escherichia coli]
MTRRILCIQDDPDIAELTNEVLADAGFRVDLAITGMRGLARLGEAHDAVLCAIALPGLGGLRPLRAMRKT